MITVTQYRESDAPGWNELIDRAKNGCFLFHRGYMEYHGDRFCDFSLIARSDNSSTPIAALPAHREDTTLISHGGLTFGGLLIDPLITFRQYSELLQEVWSFLLANGITQLVYKAPPSIFHRHPAEEDRFMLCAANARVRECNLLSVLSLDQPAMIQERRVRGTEKAIRNQLTIRTSEELCEFWELLEGTLRSTSVQKPVHNLSEIQLLRERFPENILLYECRSADSLLGGILIFKTSQVITAQYIAASDEGKRLSALDLLIRRIFELYFQQMKYFNLGASRDPVSRKLVPGLIDYKEGFGARSTCLITYEVDVTPESLKDISRVYDKSPGNILT